MGENELQTAKIFLNSISFKLWQDYCRFRSKLATVYGGNATYEYHSITSKDIKKYILPSKAFHCWVRIYILRLYLLETLIQNPASKIKKTIPPKAKKIIRKYIQIIYGLISRDVSTYIRREFARWSEIRPNTSLDIIIFGITTYDYRFQRPQQLANSLSKLGHRVFYIESEFNYAFSSSKSRIKVNKKSDNLYIVKLSAPDNYFIYSETPTKKGSEILISSVKRLMRVAKMVNPVSKIDHPFWYCVASKLKTPIVYDAMDLHSGFSETGTMVDTHETSLSKLSDLIVTSSDYLQKQFRVYRNKQIQIKNAGDYVHFYPANQKLPKPKDIQSIDGKIIGYYGAIADWIDDKIIENISTSLPDCSIVLIGRIQNQRIELLAKKYPNIHLLGEKSYEELPLYLSWFDVAMIPFKITPLIKATNPVKIYEYFASGKPVVSTLIPELYEYRDIMYLAKDNVKFIKHLKFALHEKSKELSQVRQQVAKQNTWEMRTNTLNSKIFDMFYPQVSVVILVYNQPKLSKMAIDSVLNRSKYPNLELIIVDNHSDKSTRSMLKQYKDVDNVKVIFNATNYGFAKGNNIGMKAATGEYIILLNNDVQITPGWIERLLYHVRSPKVGLVGPVTNSIGNESKINIHYDPTNRNQMEDNVANYVYSHWGETLPLKRIAAFCWILSRETYKRIGDLDERFGRGLFEDDDYCMRIKKVNLDILCAEDAFVHHYGGASTNWGTPEFQKLFNDNKVKFENKWHTKWIPHQYRKK